MSDTIYVVYGSCGEWSDHRTWCVAYLTDELEAQAYVKLCQEQADAIPEGFNRFDYPSPHLKCPRPEDYGGQTIQWKAAYDIYCEELRRLQVEWLRAHGITADPNFDHSYTGTRYSYHPLERGRDVATLFREGAAARRAHQVNSCPSCARPFDEELP